jgi:hypothetical protein
LPALFGTTGGVSLVLGVAWLTPAAVKLIAS